MQTYKIPGAPYDGAGISSHQSADGSMFFVYSGKNPDEVFKQQVARFHKNKWHWYDVPVQHHARPTATVEPDGLYITYYTDKVGTTRRWKVPDFVTPAYPSNGDAGMSPPTSPPTPPASGEVVDTVAREQNRQQAAQIDALRKELNELKKRPTGGLTWLQIKDHLWSDNIIQDKVYLDLQQKGGIYGMIESLVKSLLK